MTKKRFFMRCYPVFFIVFVASLYVELTEYLFLGLLDGIMIDLHLLGEVLFEPFVLLDVLVDELDGKLTVYLYGGFAFLAVVEPCFRPPPDSALVGIDADESRDVETLDVYFQFGKWINESAAGYCFVIGFFFTA